MTSEAPASTALQAAILVLGVWAARSFERSLLTLVTLVAVWAILHGVNEILAAFTPREGGKQVEPARPLTHRPTHVSRLPAWRGW